MSQEETTLNLSPMDQLQSLAEDEGKSLHQVLHEALFLLNRERMRQMDRRARQTQQDSDTALHSTWAREDLMRDAGVMEDLATVYRIPQEWQALVESVKVRAKQV